jgi:drug/metabolite transporter (DMT)-like permease
VLCDTSPVPPHTATSRRLATLLGLTAILLWSASVALVRSTGERLGPVTAGAIVYLLAGGGPLATQAARGEATPALRLPPRYLYGCGALFVGYTIAFFLALGASASRVQTLEVGLLNYLWPVLTLVLSGPLLGYRARGTLWPGAALAILGVALVTLQGPGTSLHGWLASSRNPLAAALGLAGAFAWAFYSNLVRRWGPRAGAGAVPWFLLASGAAFLVLALARAAAPRLTAGVLAECAALALVTGLGYLFWERAMRAGDHTLVAAASYLMPLFSTLVSCLYLRVAATGALWLGCALLVVGSLVSWASVRPAAAPRGGR